jgi:acyl carrier protein
MRDRIRATMATVFELPVERIGPDADSQTIEGWDSLRHLELMLELEMAFGVRLPADELPELVSVGAIEDALREHGAT